MRRLFKYGIIMCVLLSAGCVAGMKTDRVPVDIGFNPVIGHDVRASEESIPFPEDWTFNVWATKSSDGATHMDDVTLAYGPQGWVADAQWPDCPLIFAAYYPSALQPEYSPGHGIIIRNFNASSDDNDVLVAMEAEYECDADVLVPLHFEHILSRVDFRVRHSLAQDIEVFAKKVVIKGFDLTGDYNLAGDHKWTVGAKDGSITAYDAGETQGLKITDVAQYVGDEYFIIPQH